MIAFDLWPDIVVVAVNLTGEDFANCVVVVAVVVDCCEPF